MVGSRSVSLAPGFGNRLVSRTTIR